MSVYKVIEIVGTSPDSWEAAAAGAVAKASGSLRDMRIGEATKFDLTIGDDGLVELYRVKLSISFKFED